MNKIYEKPEFKITSFNAEDIMSLSVVKGPQTEFNSYEYQGWNY